MFWRHYFNVKLNCFILRTTTVAGLGVPIFRVITVFIVGTKAKSVNPGWVKASLHGDTYYMICYAVI